MSEAKKDKSYLHFVVMVAIMVLFRFIPGPGSVTSYGMSILGIFVGLIYGWTFIGLLIPSLAGAVLLATTGYGSVQDVLIAMFSNSTVLMMLIGILAFLAVQQSGAGDWAVAKLLNSKLAKKSPVMIMEVFFLIFILGNVCGIVWFLYFSLLPLMSNMLLKCGYEKGDKFNFFFLAGCLMLGQMGMCIFPFMSWSLMTVGTIMQLSQTMISYSAYMLLMVILIVLVMVTYPFLMKLCGCSFEKLGTVDVAEAFPNVKGDAKLTERQKWAIWSVIAFIVATIILSVLSSSVPVLATINTQVGVLGLMVILWLFVVLFKTSDGKPLMDMREAAASFQWDMLMLIAVALLISSVVTSEDTGISAWLSGMLIPMFTGKSQFFFLFILAIITIVLTNVANNIAICFIMINIVCSMYTNGFAVNLTAVAIIISLTSVFVAYLTPAASLPGALLHADNSLKPSTMYKWTWPLMLYGAVILMVVLIPYIMIAG